MKRLLAALLLSIIACAAWAMPEGALRIGILDARPERLAVAYWQPLADYLSGKLGQAVEVRTYRHRELEAAVEQHAIDVAITSSGHYVMLQQTSGLSSPLATIISREGEHTISAYGGVIVARADRTDISSLADLRGKRIAAVAVEALGGYQAQTFEMLEAGLPAPEEGQLQLTGLPHDLVISAVLAGTADAGFIRSGMIEAWIKEGKLHTHQLKIINQQNLPAFPDITSTRLYPEWPVAVLRHVDKQVASRLAAALLSLPHGSLKDGVYGFEIPANYDGVQELLQRLRLPPFDRAPDFTFNDLWHRYGNWILALAATIAALAGAIAGLVGLYRRAHASALAVQALNAALQDERRLFVSGPTVAVKRRAEKGWPMEYASPNIQERFGYAPGDFTDGRLSYTGIIHPDDRSRVVAEAEKHAAVGTPHFEQEYRIARADGTYLWIYDFTAIVRDAEGKATHYQGHLIDITERKAAEEKLHASEQAFRAVVEHSPDSITRYDRDCRRTYVNPVGLAFFSQPKEEVLGRTPEEFSPLPSTIQYLKQLRHVLATGEEVAEELPIRTLAGETRWGHVRFVPEYGPDGAVADVLVIGRDITELKLRERQFRALAENSPDVIVRYDRECRRIYVNPEFERAFGLKSVETLGKTPIEALVMPPAVAAEYARWLREAIANGKAARTDLSWEAAGIQRCWFVRAVPELDPNGEATGAITIWSDISERKAMEEALRASEREFRTLAENIPDHLIRYDKAGRKTYVNAAMIRLMGLGSESLLGRRTDENPPSAWTLPVERITATLGKVLHSGEPQDLEISLLHAVGGVQYHNLRFVAERDEQGAIVGALMVGRDMTAYKLAEAELARYRQHLEELVAVRTAELAQARDAAEAANRAKTVFLANMSHELRTPLNAILGFAELMTRDAGIPDAQRHNLDTINRSGHLLLSLINDILEISKIEAGRLTAQVEACDLHEVLAALVESTEPRARQSGLQLTLHMDESVPSYVSTDVCKLRQILINLLSNAIKYTLGGSVDLTVRAEPADADGPGGDERCTLLFVVRDTGIGIAAEELEAIFQPFYQTEHGARLGEGTGLGLTLSRQYAQLLGGDLTAESEEGQGSVFTLRLPVAKASAAPALVKPRRVIGLAPEERSRRILIVENRPDNRILLEQLMLQTGFETRIAADGEQAVAAFADWRPDFIWMDMRMPVMDGYEATRRIRALPGGDKVKIVALTASVFREDRGEILAAGCDGVLDKPLDESRLFATMERLLNLHFDYAETPAASAETPAPIDLAKLPAALREPLCQAARSLDVEATAEAIARVRDADPDLAERLDKLARSYQYDRIVSLCDSIKEDHEQPG